MFLRIFLISTDQTLVHYLKKYFSQKDVSIEIPDHLQNAFHNALKSGGDIFVTDTHLLPEPINFSINLLNDMPEAPITVLLEEDEATEKHADLLAKGADMVLYKGLSHKTIAEAIDSVIESRFQFLAKINPASATSTARIDSFLGESSKIKLFLETVKKVIPCTSPVLITGETGTGKELLAKIIHNESPRHHGPFIAINCAALPDTLLESELFGHEKGAFTGAVRTRRGAFELAHKGTIFLDEIGELPIQMQVKLLRVLQEYEVRPLGGEKCITVDTRVIAATNINIQDAIKKGQFRQDLYYRIGVFTLTIPPLRERPEDIPLIATKYMGKFSRRINRNVKKISEDALIGLERYPWPGNVRELINVMERVVILCPGDTITLNELPDEFHSLGSIDTGDIIDKNILIDRPLHELKEEMVEKLERIYIKQALTKTEGRVARAAAIAGIHPRGMYDKMKKYGIQKEDFKPTREQ